MTAPTRRTIGRIKPDVRNITFSDKLYARLSMRGKTIAEITRDNFMSFSAVIDALRAMTPHAAGLCTLTLRNMSRGWRIERPLMLYAEPYRY